MKIILNNKEYELIKEYKDAFNLDEVASLATEYFEGFDYILGDYAYNKLRLKGFYDDSNKKANDINKFSYMDEYISKYCAYECRYFILKRKKWQNCVELSWIYGKMDIYGMKRRTAKCQKIKKLCQSF